MGCGTTCACLGDERNLREFLVADETAQRLRRAGHAAISLLVNDSLDPLNYRQLRIAANKDEALIERWVDWCGKPIAHVPDPWDCHASYAAHFEEALLDRLHGLDCHPNLISTASLYDGGLYEPYVELVLERHEELMEFISGRFEGYQPEKLFWVLCSQCGYMDETRIEKTSGREVTYYCRRCDRTTSVPVDEIRGKLNWKLDCAARWVILNIDAEPFSKDYLEPKAGSFVVAQEMSKRFFGGHDIVPIRYGSVKMPKSMSYRLLSSLPAEMLRALFTERPTADLDLTPDHVMSLASRYKLEYGLSYLDWIRQLMPMWMLRPQSLSDRQLDLLAHGIRFANDFLEQETSLRLPTREQMQDIGAEVMASMHAFLMDIIRLRDGGCASWDEFCTPAKQLVAELGCDKQEVTGQLRAILGQKQGLPIARLLFLMPMDYLEALEYMLHLRLGYPGGGVSIIEKLAA